ncbi:MAG: branched-chain amino acid ABC transporter permease [Enhydrobacter sp.]|nr:MAG: branched-chain amino acid ABC transporter permease [Enhydrobacter sp.]
MAFFLALLIDGALAGAIYTLIALAFVLVYKASRMINFALGEWIMVAAALAGTGVHVLDLGPIGAVVFASAVMVALAVGFSRLVMGRLVGRPAIAAIMVTLGLGMAMRGVYPPLFGGTPAMLPPTLLKEPLMVGDLAIATDKLVAAALAILCTGLVGLFYRYSRTGVALQAMADDPQAAAAVGIDVDRHLAIAWAMAGVVAVIAGVLWVFVAGSGFGVALVGLKVFPIVIIGGLDSIGGTIVAAIAIGILESLGAGYLDERLGSGFGSIVPYFVLLAMLALRPHGLFGRARIERV